MTLAIPVPTATRRADFTVIGLVGVAHGTSHIFHLLLPSLFPVFMRDFGFSYAQLGLLVTTFFVVSGVGQAAAGFLVDRVGARPVLLCAMGLFAVSALFAASAQSYAGLAAAAVLAGLGNAPFHPADFTILNQRVSVARLGHAFSAHGIAGSLGWALAPLFMVGVSQWSGSWRVACVAAALWALLVLLGLWLRRDELGDRPKVARPVRALGLTSGMGECANTAVATVPSTKKSTSAGTGTSTSAGTSESTSASASQVASDADIARASVDANTGAAEGPFAFLRLPSVWLCFAFFFWSAAALSAIQSFAGPALAAAYGLPVSATALVLTAYMVFGALGTVAGGFMAARFQQVERTIAWAMAASAGLLLLVASACLPAAVAAVAVVLAGLGSGVAGPSRDLLIKRVSPPGATGRVYGTVYSGLDVGFSVSAPIFGLWMDRGLPLGVFAGAALCLLVAMGCAAWVAGHGARSSRPDLATPAG